MVSTGEPSQLGKWGQYDFRKIIASISLDFWKHEKLFLLAHLFYFRITQSCCSVSQLCPTVQPHGLQHTRLPWPSLSPGVCANSCHWDDDVIQPSRPLSPLLLLPSVFLSIRVFSNESALRIRWPKYWSFSFSISPSNEYSGLISFRINWLDLLAVQGTLKSLFQHQSESSNSLVSSLLYGPTLTSIHDYWKTIALTVWTFVAKWCLCFLICSLGLS